MAVSGEPQSQIGVVGLWHLGCTVVACWANQGYFVRAIDLDEHVVRALRTGHPPIFEPGLSESIRSAVDGGKVSFSTDFRTLSGCRFVFVAYDTPVRDDDTSDLKIIHDTIEQMGPYLDPHTIVIISAQLPLGTARVLRSRLQKVDRSIELVYSPENLRLGEALACYTHPGHVVIGADSEKAAAAVEELFAPMEAVSLKMSLPSAEMTKHAINSFLAASITLANQWADLCSTVGADFYDVASAMRHDPRIGKQAYLTPGIGFSGGTLGRDLRVLEELNLEKAGGVSPIFGEIWRYNKARINVVRGRCEQALGSVEGRMIALFGVTYKPGTSTLRRSLPLEVAADLRKRGASVRAFDPKADWKEVPLSSGLAVCDSPYEAAHGADLLVLLTEWPEFLSLDYGRIKAAMAQPILFDTKNMLRLRRSELEQLGFRLLTIGRA